MSAEKIKSTRYRCRCELPDCPGKGEPWLSKGNRVPERCNWCLRRTWNGTDKRKNTLLTAHGKTQRLSAWAKESGLSVQLIHHRVKIGMSTEDAVTIPAGSARKVVDNATHP